jgi:N-acetylmuramic acid 6-phosphate (MurNAc-6-P) etherase
MLDGFPGKCRLGILDASEIPPTFAADPDQFIDVIAGTDAAIRRAQEGAEDSASLARTDLNSLNINPDLANPIGIAATGRTPYVLVCLEFAGGAGMCYDWPCVRGPFCYRAIGACRLSDCTASGA